MFFPQSKNTCALPEIDDRVPPNFFQWPEADVWCISAHAQEGVGVCSGHSEDQSDAQYAGLV